ncbi:MAG: MFS transporter [Anaerolineae bacterium]|nr:MFS transporter [Anaerolineae bacterium]
MISSVLKRPTALFANVSAIEQRNIRLLYMEIIFASVLGAAMSFNSAFAIRLGASKEVIALLSSLPPLLFALTSVPFARFIQRRADRKRWLVGSLWTTRLGYIVVALIPLIAPVNPGVWLVVWLIVLNLPSSLFTSGWQALLGDLVSEQRRAFVLSRRSIFWSIGGVVVAAVAGFWLDRMPFPHNYQAMYLVAFLFAIGSTLSVQSLTVPPPLGAPSVTGVPAATETASRAARNTTTTRMSVPIRRFLFNQGVYAFGLTLPSGLFSIFYIEVLGATDGWLGLNNAAAPLGVIFGYLVWERLTRRRGFIWGLKRAMLLTWFFPVALALFPDLTIILFMNFLVNLAHPGVDLSAFNTMLKLAPPESRTVYMGWYNTVLNAAYFLGPLVGVWVANLAGIPAAMLASGALRFLGGLLQTVNRVDVQEAGDSPTPA